MRQPGSAGLHSCESRAAGGFHVRPLRAISSHLWDLQTVRQSRWTCTIASTARTGPNPPAEGGVRTAPARATGTSGPQRCLGRGSLRRLTSLKPASFGSVHIVISLCQRLEWDTKNLPAPTFRGLARAGGFELNEEIKTRSAYWHLGYCCEVKHH